MFYLAAPAASARSAADGPDGAGGSLPPAVLRVIVYLLQENNEPPNGIIDKPSAETTVCLGCPVEFAGSGMDPDGDVLSYHWNFGSAGVDDCWEEDPGLVVFDRPGTHLVTLLVTDAEGEPDPSPATVRVTVLDNRAPESRIDSPADGLLVNPGEPVFFTGTGEDPENHLPLTYHWEFGTPRIPVSSEEDPGVVRFDESGIYQVRFTVTDGKGVADPSPAEVTVHVNYPPDGFIDLPAGEIVVNPGGQVVFSGHGIDPENHVPLRYHWEFGDPAIPAADTRDPGPVMFPRAGRYQVSLTVTDSRNLADPDPATVTVMVNSPPESTITAPSGNILVSRDQAVDFAGIGTDPDGDALSYAWDFDGDGTVDSTAQDPPPHVYPSAGQYLVTLTVTDSHGLADATPAQVYVFVDQGESGEQLIDDESNGFSTTTWWGWESSPDGCDFVGSRYLLGREGNCDGAATWSFPVEQFGVYEILVHWPAFDNASCYSPAGPAGWYSFSWEAPYTVFNNGVERGRFRLDHRLGGGTEFTSLGAFLFAPGNASLQLYNIPSGLVRADAVRLVYHSDIRPRLQIVSPQDKGLETSATVMARVLSYNIPADWTVRFILDNSNGNPRYGTPCSEAGYVCLALDGLNRGEHSLLVEAVDNRGNVQASDWIGFGVGDYYVLVGDSITAGYKDDDSSDNISADGRDRYGGWIPFGEQLHAQGGYGPVLNDLLTAALGYPHTLVNEGVGGASSHDGARRIVALLNLHPKATHFLIQYGTNDALPTMQVPSGTGLEPGEEGYTGSFKDNLQQIITAVLRAGRQVLLAKVPIALGDSSLSQRFSDPDQAEVNRRIREYNVVIDELVEKNSIGVVPPDFYTYFKNHQNQFSDNLHPNGAGYRNMARLWSEQIVR